MIINFGNDMFEAWQSLNNKYLLEFVSPTFQLRGADLSVSTLDSSMVTSVGGGWGLPGESDMPPLFPLAKRTALLERRYIQESLREECLKRLTKILPKRTGFPTTVAFPFLRLSHDTPTGGGCLLAATFCWWGKGFHIRVLSRASEITKALLADLYLMRKVIGELLTEAGAASGVDVLNDVLPVTQIVWNTVLSSQSRVYAPPYMLHVWPKDNVMQYLVNNPTNDWQQHLSWFFWTRFIYPDVHTKRQQTQRVVERFLADAEAMGYPDFELVARDLKIPRMMSSNDYKEKFKIVQAPPKE